MIVRAPEIAREKTKRGAGLAKGPAETRIKRLTEAALGYQQMLERNPCDVEALVGMSVVALASRQTEAAVKMATAGVAAAPKMGTAWVVLGQALKAEDASKKRNTPTVRRYD